MPYSFQSIPKFLPPEEIILSMYSHVQLCDVQSKICHVIVTDITIMLSFESIRTQPKKFILLVLCEGLCSLIEIYINVVFFIIYFFK